MDSPARTVSALALLALALGQAAAQTTNLVASHFSGNLYSLSYTASGGGAGRLAQTASQRAGGTWPAWLTYDGASRTLYTVDEANWVGPVFTEFKVAADGKLTKGAASPKSGGELHSTLYGGQDGKGFIAGAQYENSGVISFKLPLSQNAQPVSKLTFTMSGPGPVPSRQNKPHLHSVFPDPTGRFLLAADLGADLIRVFSINPTSGVLTSCANIASGRGDGPRHGAFWTKNGATVLYVTNELSNSVSAYTASYPSSPSGGCLGLTRTQTMSSLGPGKAAPAGAKAAEVRVRDDFVYVSNRNDQTFGSRQDAIATYAVGAGGALTFVENVNSRSYFPRTFEINRAGDLVAVGGQTSSNVAVLSRNVTSGRIGGLVATLNVGSAGTVNNEDGLSHVVWIE
ncbi:hypothetical protein GGTG_05726 [Gaeumannomyces tritici R3-111a-1]|uniref:6-phosphogluconolactonase n=1 Tax=Gaeumannomyces tritici (strain R3-111a-1) TaxID=644352 RepID=J3NWR4_GAET3|nr:hypothetical protein GGTG_05726 [Gaeumannomyces tritici R3-111a-1]EJT75796.1 hypothetical protein GGTG_05726 [Gaeumannomyces tritici R3-111a-1]